MIEEEKVIENMRDDFSEFMKPFLMKHGPIVSIEVAYNIWVSATNKAIENITTYWDTGSL